MKVCDGVFSALQMDFPSCSSLEAVEFVEKILFALYPGMMEFIRPVTPAERAAGIGSEYGAPFISKADGGITRLYGNSIPLN
jgi:hypothetical protein